jgi:hypothetical protein
MLSIHASRIVVPRLDGPASPEQNLFHPPLTHHTHSDWPAVIAFPRGYRHRGQSSERGRNSEEILQVFALPGILGLVQWWSRSDRRGMQEDVYTVIGGGRDWRKRVGDAECVCKVASE